MSKKMYELRNQRGEDVLGGSVSEDHVYIAIYGELVDGCKHWKDLEVGESTRKVYALSGAKPTTYHLVRVA